MDNIKVFMEKFIDEMQTTKNLAEKTVIAYRSDLNAFVDYLNGDELREEVLVNYVRWLVNERQLKTSTINRKVIVIKKEYLAQYFDNGYIMFVISCDDGRAGSLEIEYLSGLPQSVVSEYLKRMPYLLITPSPTPN